MQAQVAIDAHDVLGEGPVWDGTAQRFLWTDNATGTVHAARLDRESGWIRSEDGSGPAARPRRACARRRFAGGERDRSVAAE